MVLASCITALVIRNTPPYEGERIGQSAYGAYGMRAYGVNGQNAVDAAVQRITSLQLLVQGHPGADVERMNRLAGEMVAVDPSTLYIMEKSVTYYNQTLAYFSVADVPLQRAWGLIVDGEEPAGAEYEYSGMGGISIDFANTLGGVEAGSGVDLSSLLGGYAADQAAEIARDFGVTSGVFTVGNRTVALGARPDNGWWSVSLPHPTDLGQTLGVLLMRDQACATVGAFEGTVDVEGKQLPAYINPMTGNPPDNGVLSVTVVASSAMDASALAKAALCAGRVEGEAFVNSVSGAQAIFVMDDGSIYMTRNMRNLFSLRASGFTVMGE